MSKQPLIKPLGAVLETAGLIYPAQIEVALLDQIQYPDLKIGEILALRGWIKQETADFFAEKWPILLMNQQEHSSSPQKHSLIYYLNQAALLDREQIRQLLAESKQSVALEELAVLRGWIKYQTLNFFQKYLLAQERAELSLYDYINHPLTRENCQLPSQADRRLKDALKSLKATLDRLDLQQQLPDEEIKS